MKRVQVMLEENTHKRLKRLAKKNKSSVSGEIRDVLKVGLHDEEKKKPAIEVLLEMAQNPIKLKRGIKDLSTNDDYLYKFP